MGSNKASQAIPRLEYGEEKDGHVWQMLGQVNTADGQLKHQGPDKKVCPTDLSNKIVIFH